MTKMFHSFCTAAWFCFCPPSRISHEVQKEKLWLGGDECSSDGAATCLVLHSNLRKLFTGLGINITTVKLEF